MKTGVWVSVAAGLAVLALPLGAQDPGKKSAPAQNEKREKKKEVPPGSAPAPPPDDSREDCQNCVRGKIDCPDCQGKKKTYPPCTECTGSGKRPCSECVNSSGRRTCGACNGSGQRRVVRYEWVETGKALKRRWKKAIYSFVTCSTCGGTKTLDCRRCLGSLQGRGFLDCMRCRGTREIPADCPNAACQDKKTKKPTGKVDCIACSGSGLVPRLGSVAEPAPPPRDLAFAGYKRVLEGYDASIQGSDENLKRLKLECEKLQEACEEYTRALRELGAMELHSDELKRSWKALKERGSSLEDESEGLVKALEAAVKHQRDSEEKQGLIQEALQKLSGKEAPRVTRDDVHQFRDFQEIYEERVAGLEERVEKFRVRLTPLEEKLESLSKAAREKRQQIEAERRLQREIQESFARHRELIEGLAAQEKLPDFKFNLHDTTTSPEDLTIELRYFDDRAKDAKIASEIEPSARSLEKLPGLIKSIFDACPEVKRVHVALEAVHLNELGKRVRTVIQSFTFDKSESFDTLMTGEYQNDWEHILSVGTVVKARPAYPRAASPSEFGAQMILILVIGLGLAVLVFLLARLRMLKD